MSIYTLWIQVPSEEVFGVWFRGYFVLLRQWLDPGIEHILLY